MPVSSGLLSLLHREENMSTTIIDQSAGPMHRCGKVWEGLRSLGTRGISTVNLWRRHQDQNVLERSLARIIETANGHRAKGLPKGSPAYIVLRETADAKIQVFSRRTMYAGDPLGNPLARWPLAVSMMRASDRSNAF